MWKKAASTAAVLAMTLTVTAAATSSPLENAEEVDAYEPARGMQVTETVGDIDGNPQHILAITGDADNFAFAVGGTQYGKALVNDMAPLGDFGDAATVAAVNGDHFSFKTGIPLGMAISDGEIIASSIEPYDADEYYFHVLGITHDGEVLVGENPALYMQFTVNDETFMLDRINRTREQWEGGQMVLYTPAYGDSTATDVMGTDIIIRVEEGAVKAGTTMRGTVVGINKDGDSPLEDGTVVVSAHILRYQEIKDIAEGDEVELSFTFEDEAWNDVVFAVGGNSVIAEDGEAVHYDYALSTFKDPQPRTAVGVKKNGDLVMMTADGRSEEAGGMTANETADYMVHELGCEYAVLLDGGGSTAMAVADDDGVLQTVNVPSEERPVGNGVLLVQTDEGGFSYAYLLPIVGALIACGAAVAVAAKRRGKNDRENEPPVEEMTNSDQTE